MCAECREIAGYDLLAERSCLQVCFEVNALDAKNFFLKICPQCNAAFQDWCAGGNIGKLTHYAHDLVSIVNAGNVFAQLCVGDADDVGAMVLEQAGKAWLEFIFHHQRTGTTEYRLDVKLLEALRLRLCANKKCYTQRDASKADKH